MRIPIWSLIFLFGILTRVYGKESSQGPIVLGGRHSNNFVLRGNRALIMHYDQLPHFIFHDEREISSFS